MRIGLQTLRSLTPLPLFANVYLLVQLLHALHDFQEDALLRKVPDAVRELVKARLDNVHGLGFCKQDLILQRRKNVHNHHRKKIFWRTLLASKKNFQACGGYKKPHKNQANHIHHRNLSSADPIFFCKENSALEQGGVWLLFPYIGP